MRKWITRARTLRALTAALMAVSIAGAVPALAVAQVAQTRGAKSTSSSDSGGGKDLGAVSDKAKDLGVTVLTAVGILAGGAAVIYGVFIERSPKIALLAILGTILAAWAVNGGLWDSGKSTSDSISGASSQSSGG